jgi:hypothetical protein
MREPVWKKRDRRKYTLPTVLIALVIVLMGVLWLERHVLPALWEWHPFVGLFIAVLALVGVLVPLLREHIGKREKAAWTLIMFILVGLEIRSMYLYNQDEVATRDQQLENATGLLNSLNESLILNERQFLINQQKFSTAISGIHKELDIETGGDSYIYFDVTQLGGPVEIPTSGIANGAIFSMAVPHFVGTFPLQNIFVSEFCPSVGWLPSIDYGTMYRDEVGRPRQSPYVQFLPNATDPTCNFWINTSNGSYGQDVRFFKVKNKWTWASLLFKYPQKQPMRYFFGPGFVRDEETMKEWPALRVKPLIRLAVP